MTEPIPAPFKDIMAEFLELELLRPCFTKPHHTWTDEEAGAFARYQAEQHRHTMDMYHTIHGPCVESLLAETCPTIQPKPHGRLTQYFVTFLRKLGVLH